MAPVFANMGLAFDGDPISRSQTPVAGRDRHGLSKAERLLGVSDTAGPRDGTPEWRPRQRKLRNMGSNLSLLTDLKNVISGVSPRSASSRIASRTPVPPLPLSPRKILPGLKVSTDQRSIRSDVGAQDRSPLSAGTLSSYHYKHPPGSHLPSIDIPDVPELPAQEKPRMGKYTEEEQNKIIDNLASNGMIAGPKKSRGKRPHTAKGHDDQKKGSSHSRGNSGASKGSNTASSRYSQDQSGRRYSQSRNGSASSAAQPYDENAAPRSSGRKSSQILTPRMEPHPPGIRVNRIDSPEGERIRTWLTYTDVSSETAPSSRPDWLAPGKLGTVPEGQSSTSVHTMTSLETGTLFPIQGGPDDWSTIKRHSRQSSVLVKNDTFRDIVGKTPTNKGSKVYYTDLAVESVLALSGSDSESDAESEASALARKRFSLASNGNETQPTAWSSTASSRSQSRKMSMNTHATSPTTRHSFSSDQLNHPMPIAQITSLSREPSGASHDPNRRQQLKSHIRQPSPMHHEIDGMDLSEYPPPVEEDIISPTDRGPPSSPTLSPRMHDPQLARMTLIAQEETPNPLLHAVREENRARKGSASSTSTTHSHSQALAPGLDVSSAPTQPAPTKPLPMPPLQIPNISTPTIQTPSADDDNSSIFSFPKPPRVLNKARSRSTDLLSSPSESIAPSLGHGQGQSATPESVGSDGSNDTIKPSSSIRRKPSSISVAAPVETSPQALSPEASANGLLSPAAAYCDGSPFVLEEFSPIVLAFPDHIRQQMEDGNGTMPQDPQLHAAAIGIAQSPETLPQSTEPETEPQPLQLEIPISPSAEVSPFEPGQALSGPRSAPLAIKTDLSPVPEGPSSPEGVYTAPPNVQHHWERAMATNFPAIPLPQGPTRPLRRFHLPTTSTASTMMRQEEAEGRGATAPVRAGTPVRAATPVGYGSNMRAATPVRAATPTRAATPVAPATNMVGGVGIARSRSPSIGHVRRGSTPKNSDGSASSTRTVRMSKRISTGKGIEPLRLSRIGNAV